MLFELARMTTVRSMWIRWANTHRLMTV